MKNWSRIMIIVIIMVGILGQIGKNLIKDSGASDIKTVEEFKELNCRIKYIYGCDKEDEEECYKSFKEYEADYVKEAIEMPNVIIGKATGNLHTEGRSLGQEIYVENSLKGNIIEEGEKAYIYSGYGISVDEKGVLEYNNVINIMEKGEKYLIFLESSDLNKYKTQKEYFISNINIGYYKLGESNLNPISLKEKEDYMEKVSNREFFASSTRIMEQLEKIKKQVIEYYIK